MPAYMYIHPFFGALGVALILGASAMKDGRRKFRKLHYATGLGAFAAALTAIGITVGTLTRFSTEIGDPYDVLPLVTFGHMQSWRPSRYSRYWPRWGWA